ncbi:unnamed protein product [Lepeophtheirus salmonis]|uniref:peptidyl-tRNA hydrolase n=1 Tax=Lepeophtheirus salmonis TaxID=72036 RepID=A0A7R8H4F1_LEPSM|nr:unnamed protein product [Lepeophtheirus salmonis]CAF2858629.1 unnamed protein product [Lepeophtheirus salmonis]
MNIIGKEVLTKIAGPKRSSLWNAARHNSRRPPRYLGRTKTQLLDVCMKSSVVVCAFISCSHSTRGRFSHLQFLETEQNKSSSNRRGETRSTFRREIQQSLKMATSSLLVQYIIIREDLVRSLAWPLGAVIAQGCHACVAVIHEFYHDEDTVKYLRDIDNMRKVVLKTKKCCPPCPKN